MEYVNNKVWQLYRLTLQVNNRFFIVPRKITVLGHLVYSRSFIATLLSKYLVMNNCVTQLQSYFTPFGYSDLKAACEIGDALDLDERKLFDIIDESRQSFGYGNWEQIDPVFCVLDHVLQMARNQIEKVTGYDFINDFSGSDSEIYVCGDYMCSCFDYSTSALEELQEKVAPYLEELSSNEYCAYFFSELGVSGE